MWIGQEKSFKDRNNAANASQFGSVLGGLIIRVSWDLIDSVNSALISGSLESECRGTDAEVVRAITAGYGSS